MKQIEGKARRVQEYDRVFKIGAPVGSIGILGFLLYYSGWQWNLLAFTIPGIILGVVAGVLLKDVP